jgi:hypothetical protein
MQSLVTRDAERLEACLRQLGFAPDESSARRLRPAVETMLASFQRRDALAEWAADPGAVTREILAAMHEAQLQHTPTHFVLVGRVLGNLGGLLVEHAGAGLSLPALLMGALVAAPPPPTTDD